MRIAAANAGVLQATISWLLPVSVAGLSGCALFGCAADHQQLERATRPRPSIPLPTLALLTPPPEPGCALKRAALLQGSTRSITPDRSPEAAGAQSQPTGTPLLGQLIKLEYERNCFQRAEWRVREKLLRLQAAVAKTIKAAKRASKNTSGP